MLKAVKRFFGYSKASSSKPISENKYTKSPKRQRVDSLLDLLRNTETTVIRYEGPTEDFVNLACEERLPISLNETTTCGSVADLAKKEISRLFITTDSLEERYWIGRKFFNSKPIGILRLHKLVEKYNSQQSSLKERYSAGRSLGYSPLQILEHHNISAKKVDPNSTEYLIEKSRDLIARTPTPKESKKSLALRGAVSLLQERNPTAKWKRFCHLELQPTKTTYEVKELEFSI